MATDTSFGEVRKFEDFLLTAVADRGDIDINANDGGTAEMVAGADGRFRLTLDGDDANDRAAVTFGRLCWTAGDGYLKMEARLLVSAITDFSLFVGFGDSIATADETIFDAASDSVTTGTQSDAIGLFWDGDQTTDQWWAVAQNTDVITEDEGLGATYNPVAATFITLGVYLSLDRKSAVWYIDGKEVHRKDSDTALVGAVALVPTVSALDQGTATNIDIDYIYAAKGRSAT